jgi:predicted aspartyl protease
MIHFTDITRKDGHIFLKIGFVSFNQQSNKGLTAMLDSGAYLTVISADTATRYGFNNLPYKNVDLRGFTGSTPAKLITVPGLMIAGWVITQVNMLVPIDANIKTVVLGQNVLEYFNYRVNHDEDRIYFDKNPNPKPQPKYIDLVGCGDVFLGAPSKR